VSLADLHLPAAFFTTHPYLATAIVVSPFILYGIYRIACLVYGLLMALILADNPEHIPDAIAAGVRFKPRKHPPPKD